jgi:hypothetical protein
MKRIIFSSFLIAGLLISLSGFSEPNYGHRGGFGYHAGVYFAAPRPFFRPVPRPVIYAAPVPYFYPAYHYGYYGHPYYHRHFCRRW